MGNQKGKLYRQIRLIFNISILDSNETKMETVNLTRVSNISHQILLKLNYFSYTRLVCEYKEFKEKKMKLN